LLAERIDTRAIRLARIAFVRDSLSAVRWKLPAAVQVGRDRAGPSSSTTPRDDPSQGAHRRIQGSANGRDTFCFRETECPNGQSTPPTMAATPTKSSSRLYHPVAGLVADFPVPRKVRHRLSARKPIAPTPRSFTGHSLSREDSPRIEARGSQQKIAGRNLAGPIQCWSPVRIVIILGSEA
jgi:hypothetical protein